MESLFCLKKSVVAAMAFVFAVLFFLYLFLNVYAFACVAYVVSMASLLILGRLQDKE